MNTVNIIGRLEKDPRLTQTKRGRDILRFTIKIDRKISVDTDFFAKADYIPCFAIDDKAVDIATNMRKGHRIGITGHLQSYLRTDGSAAGFYQIEVYVDRYESLTPRMPRYMEEEQTA